MFLIRYESTNFFCEQPDRKYFNLWTLCYHNNSTVTQKQPQTTLRQLGMAVFQKKLHLQNQIVGRFTQLVMISPLRYWNISNLMLRFNTESIMEECKDNGFWSSENQNGIPIYNKTWGLRKINSSFLIHKMRSHITWWPVESIYLGSNPSSSNFYFCDLWKVS